MTARPGVTLAGVGFSRTELRDLAAAWVVLALAFTVVLNFREIQAAFQGRAIDPAALGFTFALSVLTVGLGVVLHEVGHKVVAIKFGQVAAFRADYNMLVFALLGSLLGFVFAAPGAVHHRGYLTGRQRGLIALAGPLVNVALALAFYLLFLVAGVDPVLGAIGSFGFFINVFLAGFNMIPFGPLDGRKVLDWNPAVFAAVFAPTAVLTLQLLGVLDLPLGALPGL